MRLVARLDWEESSWIFGIVTREWVYGDSDLVRVMWCDGRVFDYTRRQLEKFRVVSNDLQ